MKKKKLLTVKYLPSLGSYLDERKIVWINNSDNNNEFITIYLDSTANDVDIWELAIDYRNWYESIVNQ